MQKLRKYFLTANRFDDMFHCSRAFYISPPIREKWGHSDITRLFEGGGLRRPVYKKKPYKIRYKEKEDPKFKNFA